jgi:hypothetical protein
MTGEAVTAKRPSGSETRRKSRVVGFRASPGEEAQLALNAERAGLTVSSYVRSRALAEPTTRAVRRPTVERAALSHILAQLGKCGSNLNQIARVLNSGGDEPGGIDAAISEFRAACGFVMQAMGKRMREPQQ